MSIYLPGLKIIKLLLQAGENFVSLSENLKKFRDDVIKLINDLNWDNGFRKDIGHKVID